ncbi:M4 family metallopeptidase [Glaciibacter psychrotolerans]
MLPGIQARTEGTPPTPDAAVNEVYDGLGSARVLLWNAFHRDSLDDHGMPLRATVHFASHYDNAVWDGSRFVFGDGDGQVFARFTRSLSALGHEFGHALVQQTADLDYLGQSGALHESLADVFGSLVDQYAHGHSAAQATWLIGEGLFIDELDAHAIRSLKAPGTAYNDDVLGKDPQPSSMADYVETDDDNGGVHLNSGIPNRAFFLVATWLGGNAWEAPGQIWYNTLTAGTLAPCVDFTGFARATTRTASSMFGEGSTEHTAVAAAWREVGVVA